MFDRPRLCPSRAGNRRRCKTGPSCHRIIRDWATFGVGSILDIDSAEIRDALARRLSDTGADTSGEAMVGLARRNDPRCFEVIDRALAAEDVGNLVVEAAAELGDPRLLPALKALDRAGWAGDDPRGQWLARAIARCSGGRR